MTQSAADLRKRIREIVRKSYDDAGVYYAERATDAILALLQPERPQPREGQALFECGGCDLVGEMPYCPKCGCGVRLFVEGSFQPAPLGVPEREREERSLDERMRRAHDKQFAKGRLKVAKVIEDASWAIESLETDIAQLRGRLERAPQPEP